MRNQNKREGENENEKHKIPFNVDGNWVEPIELTEL